MVTINIDEMTKALAILDKIVRKTSVSPVLSGIKLTARQNSLTIDGTDLEISAQVSIPCETGDTEFETVTQLMPFSKAIRAFEDGQLDLELAKQLTLRHPSKGTIKLSVLPAEMFPRIDYEKESLINEIAFDQVETLVGRFVASPDDPRQQLTGVCLRLNANGTAALGTDGVQVAMLRIDETPQADEIDFIIPRRVVGLAADLGKAEVFAGPNRASLVVESGSVRLKSQLINANYPKIDHFFNLNAEPSLSLRLPLAEIQSATEVSLACSGNLPLPVAQIDVKDGEVLFRATFQAADIRLMLHPLEANGNGSIRFNVAKVHNALRSAESEITIEQFEKASKLIRFTSETRAGWAYLLAPIISVQNTGSEPEGE
jgi:DNA polymerase-3 subunit beta